MVYASCLSVVINSTVSFHSSKPPGLDDKLYSLLSLRLLEVNGVRQWLAWERIVAPL